MGAPLVEGEVAFPELEEELNLPAKALKGKNFNWGIELGREVGDEDRPVAKSKGIWSKAAVFALGSRLTNPTSSLSSHLVGNR